MPRATLLALVFLVGISSCSERRHFYFVGRVYDGVTGQRLTRYSIDLQYLDKHIGGSVDGDGRYFVGPLTTFNDYTVEIKATGYRSFLSHNMMHTDDSPDVDTSFYFDAYLFPLNLQAPAATLRFTLSDSDAAPSGVIRFRPGSHSSLTSGPTQMPAGVGTQVWDNDEDFQFATVTRDFSNGILQLSAGELVYGVKYTVTVFNVMGHQDLTATYQAGVDGDAAFILKPFNNAPLAIAFISTQLGVPIPTGSLTIVFNQPVELDPLVASETMRIALDNAFSIVSPDANNNNMRNTLKPSGPTGARGVQITVEGNKITFSWNPTTALMTTDPGDPINQVVWGGLDKIQVRPVGGPLDTSTTVGALLGATSVPVVVTP
jgi:hypothetical protein